jgi:hypothetical protein
VWPDTPGDPEVVVPTKSRLSQNVDADLGVSVDAALMEPSRGSRIRGFLVFSAKRVISKNSARCVIRSTLRHVCSLAREDTYYYVNVPDSKEP